MEDKAFKNHKYFYRTQCQSRPVNTLCSGWTSASSAKPRIGNDSVANKP